MFFFSLLTWLSDPWAKLNNTIQLSLFYKLFEFVS